ncbi:MAG TPA: sodium:proton antiporter [Patescibacteria group bacterium]|nr:sodium:proton antiporter [Patescibacteria group bacterium]
MSEAGSAATLDAIRVVVALVSVAALAALVVARLRIPYSVTLVVLGLIAGALLPRGTIQVTPELVLLVLVPGLVFEAALRLDLEHLRPTFGWIVLLAAPGVLISALIVAVVLQLATGLRFELGLVVGSMVAATDPVAVIATFRRLRVPPRLATLVEGESLANDGTALVLFSATVAAIAGSTSVAEIAQDIVVSVVSSVGIGLVAGWLASRLLAFVDDRPIELTISIAAAYGTYLLADGLEQSGIIATVVAGLVIGSYGRRHGLSPRALDTLDVVWELIAFLLTAFAFLLVGLAISPSDLVADAGTILWGLVAVLVARAVAVYGLVGGLAALMGERAHWPKPPIGWLHVLFWAGLRGAVAIAMALSLPEDFPQRALLQQITFGVVLFTLFVQGTTAGLVVGRTGARGEAAAGAGQRA